VIAAAAISLAETNYQTFLPPFAVLLDCGLCAGAHARSFADGPLTALVHLLISAA